MDTGGLDFLKALFEARVVLCILLLRILYTAECLVAKHEVWDVVLCCLKILARADGFTLNGPRGVVCRLQQGVLRSHVLPKELLIVVDQRTVGTCCDLALLQSQWFFSERTMRFETLFWSLVLPLLQLHEVVVSFVHFWSVFKIKQKCLRGQLSIKLPLGPWAWENFCPGTHRVIFLLLGNVSPEDLVPVQDPLTRILV